jgi:hypothetical protein
MMQIKNEDLNKRITKLNYEKIKSDQRLHQLE